MKVKNLILGIGIFVVYMLALVYGIEAFYSSPQYDDFCSRGIYERPVPAIVRDTKDPVCNVSNEIQNQIDECYNEKGFLENTYNEKGCVESVECNFCNLEYENYRTKHDKNVFVIALVVGILTLLVGYLVLSVEPVGSALIASGIGSIFYGSVRNWQNLTDVWRFLLLFLALVLLIWIALRLNVVVGKSVKKKR